MASWIRGGTSRISDGDFDGEQIETPRLNEPYGDISDQEAIEMVWLDYVDRGATPVRLAKLLNVPKSTLYDALGRARLLKASRSDAPPDPDVAILFPVNAFTPTSKCVHPNPIPDGKAEYCPSCDETGIEGHAALRRRPGDTAMPAAGAKSYARTGGLMGGIGA